jgi:hypothetical protein
MLQTNFFSPSQWAMQTFGQVKLGDKRRTKRAVSLAADLVRQPNASLPQQLDNLASLKAAYRLLNEPAVSYGALIAPHFRQTRTLLEHLPMALLLQDTTELDYTSHSTTSGLGPIGDGGGKGLMLQSVLALSPQHTEVLGLIHQEPFLRKEAPKNQTCKQRHKRQRESQVWVRAVEAVGEPPTSCQWVHVGDRYSDFFEFMDQCRLNSSDFLLRAAQQRRVCEPAQAENVQTLLSSARNWPSQDEQSLALPARHGKPARVALLKMAFSPLTILPPRHSPKKPPLSVWVVRVWEAASPIGEESLEWVLITSVATTTLEQAWERVGWYRLRWIIEEYHQCLKSGCRIEQRLLRTGEGLQRLLGLIAPIAVRLLQLRDKARDNPEAKALCRVPVEEALVVAALCQTPPSQLTVGQFWQGVAKAGGYLGRKGDGPPGLTSLWRGWWYIQNLIEGIHLASKISATHCG